MGYAPTSKDGATSHTHLVTRIVTKITVGRTANPINDSGALAVPRTVGHRVAALVPAQRINSVMHVVLGAFMAVWLLGRTNERVGGVGLQV
jgi:hypothetical protein